MLPRCVSIFTHNSFIINFLVNVKNIELFTQFVNELAKIEAIVSFVHRQFENAACHDNVSVLHFLLLHVVFIWKKLNYQQHVIAML